MDRDIPNALFEALLNGKIDRRQFIRTATALGLSVSVIQPLLAACSPAPVTTPTGAVAVPSTATPVPKPKTSTKVTVGLGGETSSLDYNYEMNALGYSIYPCLYESLLSTDATTGEVRAGLATEWARVDDLTWEFKLKKGVKFHNGEEFTAQAVRDTYTAVLTTDPPASIIARINLIDRVDIVDPYTVRFHTKSPFVLLLSGVASVYIYPSEYYKKVGQKDFGHSPIGTGPWKFKEWKNGVSITLEKFEGYWGKPAPINELVFKFYPESATGLAALETKEIDIIANVPPDDVKTLQSIGMNVAWTPLGQGMVIQIVSRRDSRLEDKRVRQALNYGIDKDELVDKMMLGFAKKLDGQVIGSDGFGYNPNLKAYPYDPQKAKELLAAAGYPNGLSIKMDTSTGRYAKQKEISEALVGQLAKIGVNVDLQVIEWGTFTRMYQKTLDTDGLFYIGWNYMPAMDADFALQHVMCSSPRKLFCSNAMDSLFNSSRQELDVEKRRKILQDLAVMIREECPVVFLFQSPDIWGVNPRVKNVKPGPDNALKFFDAVVDEA